MIKSLSLSAFLILSAGLCIFLGFVASLRRGAPGARPFCLVMFAAAVYAVGEAFELSGGSLARIYLAVKFEYLGIAFLAPLWLLFTLEFCERPLPPKPLVALLFAESIFTVAMVWTTDYHGLFYSRAWIREGGPFPLIGLEHGIAYWMHTAAMWAESAAGCAVIALYAVRAPAPVRDSALLPVAGVLVNLAANLMLLAGVTPYGIDLGPFGMALAGVAFAVALRGNRFLILLPVARELALESMDDGMVILDSSGAVVDFNPAAARLLGLDEPVAPGRGSLRGWDRGQVPGSREGMAKALDRPELAPLLASGEGCCYIDSSAAGEGEGEGGRVKARTFPVKDGRGSTIGLCLLLSDVTETALLLDRLAELASIDGLTGVLNKRRFEEIGARDMDLSRRSSESVGVLMLDLDHFKLVNDEWGHAAGDEVLREVCRRCRRELRCSDVLGRLGGEEFAVFLPASDREGTLAAAERLRAAIGDSPIAWEGGAISVTASVGSCDAVPGEGEDLSLLLRRADEALYEAKTSGRNRVVAWRPRAALKPQSRNAARGA